MTIMKRKLITTDPYEVFFMTAPLPGFFVVPDPAVELWPPLPWVVVWPGLENCIQIINQFTQSFYWWVNSYLSVEAPCPPEPVDDVVDSGVTHSFWKVDQDVWHQWSVFDKQCSMTSNDFQECPISNWLFNWKIVFLNFVIFRNSGLPG